MWIARDPKKHGPPEGAWKFSQVFVIAGRTTRRLLPQFQRDDRAIRQTEDGAALSVVFLPRFVIRDLQEIVSFHVATIHRIIARDNSETRISKTILQPRMHTNKRESKRVTTSNWEAESGSQESGKNPCHSRFLFFQFA
jgi:hypothetical protein